MGYSKGYAALFELSIFVFTQGKYQVDPPYAKVCPVGPRGG